jgi:TRAP-type C4-dicarboxylate transport system permease small subunit
VSSKPAGLPAWISAVHGLSRLLGVVAALMILVSIVVVCQMVFVRTVLGESSIWQTEFVMYLLVAATFIGAPYILLTRGHVAVDVVPLMAGPRTRRALHFVGSLIGLGFCGLFLWAAIPWWHEAFTSGETTPSIWRARMWIPTLAVPVGLGLLCLQYLAEMWLVITQRENPFGLAPEDRL